MRFLLLVLLKGQVIVLPVNIIDKSPQRWKKDVKYQGYNKLHSNSKLN